MLENNGKKLAIAMASLIALAACGQKQDTKTEARTDSVVGELVAERPAPVPDDFEFMRFATNDASVTPEICLTFSKPLDPAADYSAYVDAGSSVALEVDGSRLCLGGLAYGETRDVTLREGLPSAGGDKLARAETISVSFDDRPSVVAFAGDGVILPRIDADGLAITTVNVDAVDITVTRVNDRALVMRAITTGYEAAAGDYWYEYDEETPGQFGEDVWTGTMSTKGPINAVMTTVFPFAKAVGTIEPGAYFVRVRHKTEDETQSPARAARWIVSTDLALTAYRGETGLDLTVRSLQAASGQPGVSVQLVAQSNEVLGTATTDGQGRVRFDAPLMNGRDGNRPKLVMAYGRDGDFALLDLGRNPVDLSAHPVSGRGRADSVDGFIYLDRGIYRPGEDVQASLLLRDPAGRALTNRSGSLVLYKPNGIEHARTRFAEMTKAGGLSSTFEIPKEAVRGSWYLALDVDGVGTVRTQYFSVEDFVPQRVALELTADTETPMRNADPRMVEATARFLYGAPGAGLTIDGTARLQRDPSPFEAYADYQFGVHDEAFSDQLLILPAVVADGAGRAAIPVTAGRDGEASTLPLRVRAVVEVEEPGGRTVADDVRIPYRPRALYFGLKSNADGRAERNTPVAFDLIALDAVGASKATDARWTLTRRDYDYDWYRVDGGDWQWRRSERIVPIESGAVRLTGEGPAIIKTPPLEWGDYRLIVSAADEDVASAGFWVGWGGYAADGSEAPDEVRVAGPADPVAVGSTASVVIKAPYAGKADVVVATDRVLSMQQIDVAAAGAEVSIPVTEEWGAGAYVMVTVYTPRDVETQPRPRRAVGVAYIPVDVGARTFDVTIDLPEKVEPNQTLTIPISAKGGTDRQNVYATVAAVDEGILLLTKHSSPDPVSWFFGKSALDVSLHDDYGRLLDPNQGAAAPIRSGGDQIGGAGLTVVPTRTVALFSGPIDLGRDGKGSVKFDLPDFNGQLRVMAVVWSDTGLGWDDHALTVRDAVPAELILPRFLSPGDAAQATLTLDNVDGAAGPYAVTLTAEGPLSVDDPSRSVELAAGQRRDDAVTIRADGAGIAALGLQVKGPRSFSAASDYPIEVRSAFWPETRVTRRMLAPGEKFTPATDVFDGFVPGSGLLFVSAAATPIDTAALYQSLYRYPYACTEQLTSRMMPLLYLGQLEALAGRNGPLGAKQEVQDAIETLLSRQSADGSFGLWRVGDADASPWLGAYAADFITRAAAAGYPVPQTARDRALEALAPVADGQLARAWGYDTDPPNPRWSSDTRERLTHRSGAYALYVRARNGKGDRSRLRYMHDELRNRIESPLALAHIGAGLAAMGDQGRARSAFDLAVARLGYKNDGDWYQTQRRDLAGVVALAAEAGLTDIVATLTERMAKDLPEPSRLTTQEKAFLILAARAVAGEATEVPVKYSGKAPDATSVMFSDATIDKAGSFENTGDRPIWVTALAEGFPAVAPAASAEGVRVDKRLFTLGGETPSLSGLAQGDRLIIELTVTSDRAALAPYIVADLLPAGFEIEEVISPDDTGDRGLYNFVGTLATPNLAEARDDRFIVAFDGRSSETYRFAYLVRAVTAGTFTLPGAIVEDMYKPDVFGRSESGTVVIRP